jgi:hypothetical protein
MKKPNSTIAIAVIASVTILIACNKQGNAVPTPNSNSVSETQVDNPNTGMKTFAGFGVVALRLDGVNSQINTAYSIVTPGSGVFTDVRFGSTTGPIVTNMTGVSRVPNVNDLLWGTTNSNSNYPTRLLRIIVGNKVASDMGPTTKITGGAIRLQDIELDQTGKFYYAIEVGTKNIWVSIPSVVGNPPLVWSLAATLPAGFSLTTDPVGLDMYSSILAVYGHGNITSLYPNTVGKIGYYVRYNLNTTTGVLTLVGGAGCNMTYAPAAGEEAALLISDDTSINGTFVICPKPANTLNYFYNVNKNLPYFLVNAVTSFGGTLPPSTLRTIIDYTYFQ